jgi:hypothetical protein
MALCEVAYADVLVELFEEVSGSAPPTSMARHLAPPILKPTLPPPPPLFSASLLTASLARTPLLRPTVHRRRYSSTSGTLSRSVCTASLAAWRSTARTISCANRT